ncbi:MAG: hypothetical protein QOH08_8 [Chloroflexota bacterium]|jgi:hypothetical protein|nr:hypothetical protein [Chloroflexota bacterium]
MALTYVPTISPRVSDDTMAISAETQRLARRASLRSSTRSLLRELIEQHDHEVNPQARALVRERMGNLRDELVAALRGDADAIESLSAQSLISAD